MLSPLATGHIVEANALRQKQAARGEAKLHTPRDSVPTGKDSFSPELPSLGKTAKSTREEHP